MQGHTGSAVLPVGDGRPTLTAALASAKAGRDMCTAAGIDSSTDAGETCSSTTLGPAEVASPSSQQSAGPRDFFTLRSPNTTQSVPAETEAQDLDAAHASSPTPDAGAKTKPHSEAPAADTAATRRPSVSKKKGMPTFNATHVMYDVVLASAEARGWKLVKAAGKATTCNVHWIDDCTSSEWFRRVEPWMKINHFPGMHNTLGRKSRLARNLARLRMRFPKEYSYVPDTWILPDDTADFQKQFDASGKSKLIFIAKPDGGTQGRGIFLSDSFEKITKATAERDPEKGPMVVQKYLRRPLLLDGMKFDLRLYFLVAGVPKNGGGWEPRFFLFKDGLVRLCTTEYVAPTADNLDKKRMHLTNYAINKKSQNFVQNDGDDDGAGSKRKLSWFLDYIAEEHGEGERDKLWNKCKGVCVKTLLGVHPTLEGAYLNTFPKDQSNGSMGCRSFEILGIDVMLDSKRRPYLLEINHLPSFTCDSPLDEDIKSRVIRQSLDLTCNMVSVGSRTAYEAACTELQAASGDAAAAGAQLAQQVAESPLNAEAYGEFERVYPPCNAPKAAARYQAILDHVTEVFRPVVPTNATSAKLTRASSLDAERSLPGGQQATALRGAPGEGTAQPGRKDSAAARNAPAAAAPLPPRPPSYRLNSSAPQPPPGGPGSPQQPTGVRRSRSAPDRSSRLQTLPACSGGGSGELPSIGSATAPPGPRLRSGTPRLPQQQARKRSASRDDIPRAQPQRVSVQMASVQLTLPTNSR